MKAELNFRNIFMLLISFFFTSSISFSQSELPPNVEWSSINYAPLDWNGNTIQSPFDTGEDWWYDHINGPSGTYIAAGYSTFKNYPSGQPGNYSYDDGCYSYSFSGIPDQYLFETADFEQGLIRQTFAKFLPDGTMAICKPFNIGSFKQIIPSQDGNYLAVSTAVNHVPLPGMNQNNMIYNPGRNQQFESFTTSSCNPGPRIHLNIVKIDQNANEMENFIYGFSDFIGSGSDAYDFNSIGQSIVQHANGYYVAGRAEFAPLGACNTKGLSFILDIDFNLHYVKSALILDKAFDPSGTTTIYSENDLLTINNCDLIYEEIQAIEIIPGTNSFVVAGHMRESDTGDTENVDAFVYRITDDGTAFSIDWDRSTRDTWGMQTYDLNLYDNCTDIDVNSSGEILVPLMVNYNTSGSIFAGVSIAEGHIYKLDANTGGIIEFLNIGEIRAYDLKIGCEALDNGEFAIVTTKLGENYQTVPNYYDMLAKFPGLEDCMYGINPTTDWPTVDIYDYWNTDAYIAMLSNDLKIKWEKKWDQTNDQPRECYPGNLKQEECMYEVWTASDGSITISGNTSDNFDDTYLVKLAPDCYNTADFSTFQQMVATNPAINEDSNNLLHFHVSQNMTWTENMKVYGEIIVDPGVDLIIDGAVIEFAYRGHKTLESNLTVKRGGKLEVRNSARLTSLSDCPDSFWSGIFVEGDVNTNQNSFHTKGYVEIINEGTIEYAHVGISNCALTFNGEVDWATTGGIIYAEDANFNNNRKSLGFVAYQNFSIDGGGNIIPKADRSSFYRCNFDINEIISASGTHDAHVTMYRVDGIDFHGCDFKNSVDQADLNGEIRGHGIRSIDATYQVVAHCPLVDCTNEQQFQRSSFVGFDRAVFSSNFSDFYTSEINRADISLNHRGIQYVNVVNSSTTQSTFAIDELIGYSGSAVNTVGILMQGCNRYEVEDNEFYATGYVDYKTGGIVIQNSGPYPNEVYRNIFDGLYVGTLAQGLNKDDIEDTGLQILCGNNMNNEYDIGLQHQGSITGKIALEPGSGGSELDDPAGNIFSNLVCTDYNSLYSFDNTSLYIYYHHQNAEATPQPGCYRPAPYVIPSPGSQFYSTWDEACPSRLSRGEIPIEFQNRVMEARTTSDFLQDEYEALADLGDTESLLAMLNAPLNSFEKRTQLLNGSPNLSELVLLEAIDVDPSLNVWHLTEVMIANSPLSPEILLAFDEANWIPQFFKDLTQNYQSGTSTLSNILSGIRSEENIEAISGGDFTRDYVLRDSSLNRNQEVFDLYANLVENQAIKTRIALHLSEGNYSSARAELLTYSSDPNLDAYADIQNIIFDWQEFDLLPDPGDIQFLNDVAISDKLGKYQARALLSYLEGATFDDEIEWPVYLPKSRVDKENKDGFMSNRESWMDIYPNPTDHYLYVGFNLSEEIPDLILRIITNEGSLIEERKVRNFGLQSFDVSALLAGLYHCNLYFRDKVIENRKFVVE